MDKPKLDNLNELALDELDAVSGGYIVDLGENEVPDFRYALVIDENSAAVLFSDSVKELIKKSKPERRYFNTEVITLEQYEQMYGKPFEIFS